MSDSLVKRAKRPPKSGVRGWLWVLCIYLAVLNPVMTLLGLLASVEWITMAWQFLPRPEAVILYACLVTVVVLAGFSVVCGVGLKNLRPMAVRYTKVLALTQLGVTALFSMLAALYFRSVYGLSHSAMREQSIGSFIWISIWVAIYAYLLMSERVRTTYGGARQ